MYRAYIRSRCHYINKLSVRGSEISPLEPEIQFREGIWKNNEYSLLAYSVTYGVLRIHTIGPAYVLPMYVKDLLGSPERIKSAVEAYFKPMFDWLDKQHGFVSGLVEVEHLLGEQNGRSETGSLGVKDCGIFSVLSWS